MASAPRVASRSPPLAPSAIRPGSAPSDAPASSLGPDRGERERLYYVDAIRVLAIALVIVAHAAEVFNPWDEWHITNPERSRAAGEIAVFVAPWVMPIVMLLAGVSAWYSLGRRDNATYLRERATRLLIPLTAGTLLLVPPQVYLERRLHGQFTGSFIAFCPHFFQGIYPHGNLSWHHLWFLAHLFAYSVIALPLFRYLQRKDGRAMRWAGRVFRAPSGLLWLAVPLILERNLLWGLFPERYMLTSDWSNHALLFVAYIYGFILAGSSWLGRIIDAKWRRALVAGAIGTALLGLGTWRGIVPWKLPPPYSIQYLAFWTLYALCAWAWIVGVLGAGRRWVKHDGPVLRYGRRVGYGLYIVHQPIIVAIAFVVVRWRLPVGTKFVIVLVTSVIGTLLSAEILARLPIARGLLGLSKPRAAAGGGST